MKAELLYFEFFKRPSFFIRPFISVLIVVKSCGVMLLPGEGDAGYEKSSDNRKKQVFQPSETDMS